MRHLAIATTFAAAVFSAGAAAPAGGKDALAHLRAARRPTFAANHTLPPLTRWGWRLTSR